MSGPFILPEAGLGGHSQRPYTEVIGPAKLVHEEIVVLPLQGQARRFLIQGCTCVRLLCYHGKRGNAVDFHGTSYSANAILLANEMAPTPRRRSPHELSGRRRVTIFRAPELENPDYHIRDQGKDKEDKQHPGNSLKRTNYRSVDLENPSIRGQLDDSRFLVPALGRDVFLNFIDPHSARHPYHEDRELQVFQPRRADVVGDDAFENIVEGLVKDKDHDKADNERD